MIRSRLKLMQINIRSLYNKKDILENYMEVNKIDIGLICETWIKDKVNISFKNYVLLDRARSDGYGGVALLINKRLKFKESREIICAPLEYIKAIIYTDSHEYHLVSFYAKPQITSTELTEGFKKIFRENNNAKNLVIAGDVNCHNSLWEVDSCNDAKGSVLADLISEEDNICVLNDGTHTYQQLSRNYTSAIDITLVSKNLALSATWRVDENLTSDHFALITELGSTIKFKKKITTHNKASTVETINQCNPNSFSSLEDIQDFLTRTIADYSKTYISNEKYHPNRGEMTKFN